MKSVDIPKFLFVAACAAILFVGGMAAGHYQTFPYSLIVTIRDVVGQRDNLLGVRPTEFITPARYEGSGVTRHNPAKSVPGHTFLTGFFDGQNEMRLVTADGQVINRWPVNFFDVFPEPDHISPKDRVPQSEWNLAVQGALLLPDGSVVFNFNFKGTAKIDRCGRVEWSIPRMTHHSVELASDGGYWIPIYEYIDDTPKYPQLTVPYEEDVILKVSADGSIEREISIVDLLQRNDLLGLIYGRAVWKHKSNGLTHVNDVEELDAETARDFPQFEAGDLMISARFGDLVLVFDPDTLVVKWFQKGPFLSQHDPDFMPGGKISVFSNNDDGTATGHLLGGSTIVEVEPDTQSAAVFYGGVPGQHFFTSRAGEHQRIGAGGENALITEARSGRVFEVSPDGEVVWEYINRYDEDSVLILNGARRYAEEYFTVSDWSCP